MIPGTRVVDDGLYGVVVEPTVDEVAYAATEYEDVGPHHGHVRVRFDDTGDRAWYGPEELRVTS